MADVDILQRLSDFIDYENPELAEFLYGMWGDQQHAITYHELRDAIMDGSLSLDYLKQWQKDYSRFIVEAYTPKVNMAIAQAAMDLREEYGYDFYDPMAANVDTFIRQHGGQLIREVTTDQYRAINTLVRQAAYTNTMTVDQLARAIRPCVGLTTRQAQTTKRYYDRLIEDGYSAKAAEKKQLVYAAKMHRRRAALIAQTEMATAYNAGWHMTIQKNVEEGVLPADTKKIWLTAEDEKVCPVCGKMHGEEVLWNEPFSDGSMYPPSHPQCRCHYKIDITQVYSEYLQRDDQTAQTETEQDEDQVLTGQEDEAIMEEETTEDSTSSTPTAPPDDVEAALNIQRGTSMDIANAATGANPNYQTGNEYQINCQRCVQTYELRRRGYDVEAMPKPSTGNTVVWGSECFPDGKKNAFDSFTFNQTEAAVKRELKNAPDDSRYVIYTKWKGRNSSAHVFIAEKTGGQVQYIDPQSGQIGVEHYFSQGRKGAFGFYRIDDKPITTDRSIITATVKGRVIKWIRQRQGKFSTLIGNMMRRRARNTATR